MMSKLGLQENEPMLAPLDIKGALSVVVE
jgi:hypothetical protein